MGCDTARARRRSGQAADGPDVIEEWPYLGTNDDVTVHETEFLRPHTYSWIVIAG